MYGRVFQAIVVFVALVGWVIYQMAIRKKRFSEMQNDILAIVFFGTVWFGIVYFIIH